MNIKVSIVEDIDMIRENLSALLNGSEGFECAGTYKDAESAVEKIPQNRPDVILMDINLPKANGIECLRKLKPIIPETQVIMLTVYDDFDNIFESLRAGATGYLLKRTHPNKLLEAIREVHSGGSPMSGQIARMVVQSFSRPQPGGGGSTAESLSKREAEILELLSKGYRYKEIAEMLFISMDTVRTHIRKIYEKLHVRSRTEAVLMYLQK